MASTRSSACFPRPAIRMYFSAFASLGGSGIFTCGLSRKPSALPSELTARFAPCSSACLRPADTSLLVRSLSDQAQAVEQASIRRSERRRDFIGTSLASAGYETRAVEHLRARHEARVAEDQILGDPA